MNNVKKTEYIDVLDELGDITGIIKSREEVKKKKIIIE